MVDRVLAERGDSILTERAPHDKCCVHRLFAALMPLVWPPRAVAMPDLLLALIFVTALGLGPLPGALALGVHTAGFLGKFFAESLERVDKGVCEGVASTGANFAQMVMYAGWPSILREALGNVLYILDRNVRMASVLGLVGAGGIGLALHDTLRLFEYGQSAALILVILATILLIDYASAWLRKRLD
ncbi:MAG: ABC transporter permease subunit [Burkholderiaceae bacterium]|nr:ABC transporter permease subunit [Burkholderiaceae bacterium]